MTDRGVAGLAKRFAAMLAAHAAHGRAISALHGTGEVTLRDGLVVAAAAAGARLNQAWIIRRESVPKGWRNTPVDLLIKRRNGQGRVVLVGGVELKWWRQDDARNSANRRRDLLRDMVRAAALYAQAEEFAFVALLTTTASWTSTTVTKGSDKGAMTLLAASGVQQWNLGKMRSSKSLMRAIASLRAQVPICNVFHTELLSEFTLNDAGKTTVFAKVWKIRKPQNSKLLDDAAIRALVSA